MVQGKKLCLFISRWSCQREATTTLKLPSDRSQTT